MEIKSALTIDEQIKLIASRGCIIEDEKFSKKVLSSVNYYRFTAYLLPFRNPDKTTYKPNTSFFKVYCVYEFDKRLRNLIMSVIEDIEVYTRTKVAYYHAHTFGPLGYENSDNYNKRHNHNKFINLIDAEINNNKGVLFVKHHITNYGGKLPIWVITELFSFGMLSRFYSDLPLKDRKHLAKDVFGYDEGIIRSWLHCCTSLRNICAHYGRLYYRLLGATPATPKSSTITFNSELFSSLLMLKLMFPDKKKWDSTFINALRGLLNEYSDSVCLKHIGFPTNWEQLLLNTISNP